MRFSLVRRPRWRPPVAPGAPFSYMPPPLCPFCLLSSSLSAQGTKQQQNGLSLSSVRLVWDLGALLCCLGSAVSFLGLASPTSLPSFYSLPRSSSAACIASTLWPRTQACRLISPPHLPFDPTSEDAGRRRRSAFASPGGERGGQTEEKGQKRKDGTMINKVLLCLRGRRRALRRHGRHHARLLHRRAERDEPAHRRRRAGRPQPTLLALSAPGYVTRGERDRYRSRNRERQRGGKTRRETDTDTETESGGGETHRERDGRRHGERQTP